MKQFVLIAKACRENYTHKWVRKKYCVMWLKLRLMLNEDKSKLIRIILPDTSKLK